MSFTIPRCSMTNSRDASPAGDATWTGFVSPVATLTVVKVWAADTKAQAPATAQASTHRPANDDPLLRSITVGMTHQAAMASH